jgi:formylglycine-generating enzyme required for sulfatase activity
MSFRVNRYALVWHVFLAGLLSQSLVPDALGQSPVTFQDCLDCPVMVIVPAGSVSIGSSSDAFDRKSNERPRQRATVAAPFALAEAEITRAQFAEFLRNSKYSPGRNDSLGKLAPEGCNYWNGSYSFVSAHDWRNPGFAQRDDEPVLCVSFDDAAAYATWLTVRTGRKYRIPSSVEFEYAARAASDAAWYWGNNSEEACKYANIGDRTLKSRWPQRQEFNCDDGFENTAPVKRFAPNAFGLYDMVGNAWEWTADCWHDDLASAPLDGRAWLAEGGGDCAFRTPMGGAWISGPGWSRIAVRSKDPIGYRSFMLGFRVAADTAK